jgi:hypothetical protein
MAALPFDFGWLILAAGIAGYLGLAFAIRQAWLRRRRRKRDVPGFEVLPPT